MKTGLIDVGGGFRGVYGAGVTDYFIDNNINFDFCIGVSAGSANIANFLAKQRKRSLTYYMEYGSRKECTGFENYIKNGTYINLDYLYRELANEGGENPLDYDTFSTNPADFEFVASDAITGAARYFGKDDLKRNDYRALIASATIPALSKPYNFDGGFYFDGGLSDFVPIQRAIEVHNCDRVVVILTKPKDYRRNEEKNLKMASKLLRYRYPEAARRLRNNYKMYNYGVDLTEHYEDQGKALIIAPEETFGMDTITRTDEGMLKLYEEGYNDAAKVKAFI